MGFSDMLFYKVFNHFKRHKKDNCFCILFFLLNVCVVTLNLFGASAISAYHNPNELDYIVNSIVVNNKNGGKEMSFWQITPDVDYYGNWHHWQLDETIYSISEFYTTRGFTDHNYTFMINYSSNREVFYSDADSTHYISLITSPSRVGFKSLGLSFLNDYQPDYKNDFFISEKLFDNLKRNDNSVDLSICSTVKNIVYSGIVKTISNNVVEGLVGDEFIVVPYKYAFEIEEYTGHTSFVLCLRNDYYENYAFSRVIKHAFYGIEKGSKHKAYFHDFVSTLSIPYERPNSVLQSDYENYTAHIPVLGIIGYSIFIPTTITALLLNLFVFIKKRKLNIYLNVLSFFCSFAIFSLASSIIQRIGTTYFFPWSYMSQIIVALICMFYVLLIFVGRWFLGEGGCKRFISDNCFYERSI